MLTLFFFSSGLFLGWSLGANDAANIFGTAVGTKMIRFRTAAAVCCIFVTIGAVFGGSGTTDTLGRLGEISALAGAFVVALAAAVTVLWMTRSGLPVSTSQAIVGAILGWNLFAGLKTDPAILSKIVGTWFFSPLLAAAVAVIIYLIVKKILMNIEIHMFTLDRYTRIALLVAGAFGAYSLGANNIANVMGVFTASSPFSDLHLGGILPISGNQQLFLMGGLAISLGVITYSKRVMLTVGSGLFNLSPIAAVIVVLASSFVLFVFSSEGLRGLLLFLGLPELPLVPVSQSQAVVGAILGISLAKGSRTLNFRLLGKIGAGWLLTPVCSGLIAYLLLYIIQNALMQPVH